MSKQDLNNNSQKLELSSIELSTKEKLFGETALINWYELQRFFAQGTVLWVSKDLDLVTIATLFAEDKASELAPFLESENIAPVSNDQARHWYDNEKELWSVVVAPFVLVQEPKAQQGNSQE